MSLTKAGIYKRDDGDTRLAYSYLFVGPLYFCLNLRPDRTFYLSAGRLLSVKVRW